MANTYSQIYLQTVFAVKGRACLLIQKAWRQEILAYMMEIIRNKNQTPIAVNGVADHVHILVGIKPSCAISDLMRDIKSNSSRLINEKKWLPLEFHWQVGFGAFSYCHNEIHTVARYIQNQEEHHKKRSFKEEYIGFLQKAGIHHYDEQYLFDWIEE